MPRAARLARPVRRPAEPVRAETSKLPADQAAQRQDQAVLAQALNWVMADQAGLLPGQVGVL